MVFSAMKAIWISLSLRLLRRNANWLSWPRERSLASDRYFRHLLLTSTGWQKSIRYGSFLVWSSRLAKSKARTRLEESDCVELVVMVNWDEDINNAVVAVNTDTGLDWFNGVLGSSPIRESLFFISNLPGGAFLTGVTWLVVALDVVFVMMGK